MASGEKHRWEDSPSTSKSAFVGDSPIWNDVKHDADVILSHAQWLCFRFVTTKNPIYYYN